MAPGVKLIAAKVCSTSIRTGCPLYALIQGLEYAVESEVDIVNLSLGVPFMSPYYSFMAKVLEDVFALGVLPVVAAGKCFRYS